MKLGSPAFADGGAIPEKYTCDSDNISPPLTVSDVPQGTMSLAVLVVDPDAPGGDFVHLIAWNLSPDLTDIPEGVIPEGAQAGTNDFGTIGWGGPCPPPGTHRYEFHLYALDAAVNLPATSAKDALRQLIAGHVLAEAVMVGTYRRR